MGFKGRLGRRRFAIFIGLVVAFYVGATVLFTFGLLGIAGACGSGGSSAIGCSVLGLVYSTVFKPLIFVIFVGGLVGPLMGRLRDIGVSPWFSLYVMLFVMADSNFLLVAGTSWSYGFSIGVMGIQLPIFLLTALALMVVLAILPGRVGVVGWRTLGWPLLLLIPVALLAAFPPVYTLARSTILMGNVARMIELLKLIAPLLVAGRYALPVVPIMAGFALWPRKGQVELPRPPAPTHPVPLVRLALLSLAIAIAVLVIAMPDFVNPVMWLVGFAPIVLPNFGLYFALVLAVYFWWRRRYRVAAPLTLVLAMVFGSWGYLHYDAMFGHQNDEGEIASIPTHVPENVPRIVFNEPEQNAYLRPLLRRTDIDVVVQRNFQDAQKMRAIRMGADGEVVSEPLLELPVRYLHLKTWSYSAYHRGGQYHGSSPYELRLIDGESDTLLRVWFRRSIEMPRILPVITMQGWATSGSVGERVERKEAIAEFFDEALGVAAEEDEEF